MAKQTSSAPTQKVVSGTLAGAITVVCFWIINTYTLLPNDVILPAEVGSAVTTIIGAFVAYLIPPALRDSIDVPKKEEKPEPVG